MSLSIGSLFTGTGALDLAVMDVYDAELVWHSQYEPPDKNGKEDKNQYAAKILARHWPDIPNLGDIAKIDWQAVIDEYGPIDILTGGFPCQDVSSAGRRAGMTPDSRSGLWSHMAHAVSILQPKLVVIENVEGLLSAPASSVLEPCPWCVGDGRDEPVLRALGAVLGDLATLGFDAEWGRFEASDVGAPHRRRRIIIRAWPAHADAANLGHERGGDARRRGHGSADGRLTAPHPGRSGLEVGGVEPDRHERPAAERGRREPAPDADRLEPERRGIAGVLGSQAAAEPGEGDQRERTGDAAGDSRETAPDPECVGRQGQRGNTRADAGREAATAVGCGSAGSSETAADADGRGREGHQECHGGSQQGQPERERGLDIVGRGVRRAAVEPACPTCGCGESFHDAGGFCAGPCGGTCADPELGRPDEADADSQGNGRHEGRPEPTRQQGRPDAAQPGSATPADAGSSRRREDVLELRPGQPDLDWGDYEPAIRRWEQVLGRPAPWPTDAAGRLSPVFTEWLMGLPDGWVTDTPGLTRAAMLRALGNGVVRQQAAHALRVLHARAAAGDSEAVA